MAGSDELGEKAKKVAELLPPAALLALAAEIAPPMESKALMIGLLAGSCLMGVFRSWPLARRGAVPNGMMEARRLGAGRGLVLGLVRLAFVYVTKPYLVYKVGETVA
jgi:hypothetical protein